MGDEFTKALENSVDDDVILQRDLKALQAELMELQGKVIKTPEDKKRMDEIAKKIATIIKEQEEKKKAKTDTKKEVTPAEHKESRIATDEVIQQEEQQEAIKDEKDLNKKIQVQEAAEDLKTTYYNAMVALHEKRLATIQKQKSSNKLVSSDSDYEQELALEAELYRARDAYLQTGKQDPYTELRTQQIRQEKIAREQIELELRNKAKRYREIENEIREIDRREQEINEELLRENIDEMQIESLQKELQELGAKRKTLELELAEVKDSLDNAIEVRRARTIKRAGLERQYVETLSTEDKKNYDYQQSKIAVMNNNFDKATTEHYRNIKKRIEEREQKIKDINKELREVPNTDFERRLVLLNELDKETNMLEADRQAKRDLDRGIVPDSIDMARDAEEKAQLEEERQEDFDEATRDVRNIVEAQSEEIGQAVVANPELVDTKERDRENTLAAAAVAVTVDSPKPGPDTALDDAKQFVVAKCVIEGLDEKVRDPNNPEDAQAMVDVDDRIRSADHELDRMQDRIQDSI